MIFHTSSDFVAHSIPKLYPNGYTTVVNCFFSRLNKEEFDDWLQTKTIPEILKEEIVFLQFGTALIYHDENYEKALEIYKIFSNENDKFYATFWENGAITNENT